MPDLTNLPSKNSQLRALQQVQNEAISAYKQLKDRDELVRLITNQQHGTCTKIQNSIHYHTPMEESSRGVTDNILIYVNLQAEKNISRYKCSTDPINHLNLLVQKGCSMEHPF